MLLSLPAASPLKSPHVPRLAANTGFPALSHPTNTQLWYRSQRPKFQCLILDGGQTPEWYEAEALISLGACTTPNISAQHSGAGACFLSAILQENVPEKYSLSPKACAGILRRAERRGKDLPPLLKAALIQQAGNW